MAIRLSELNSWQVGEIPTINKDYYVTFPFWKWLTKSEPGIGSQFRFSHARVLLEVVEVDITVEAARVRSSRF